MFFNKKVFHHTSFDMRIFSSDARQSEIFDVSSISTNCTGYVNIFLSYVISEELNLFFFSGIRSQVLSYYNFCILVDHFAHHYFTIQARTIQQDKKVSWLILLPEFMG